MPAANARMDSFPTKWPQTTRNIPSDAGVSFFIAYPRTLSFCQNKKQNHSPKQAKQQRLSKNDNASNCISKCLTSSYIRKIILFFREHPYLPNFIILVVQALIEFVIFLDVILDLVVIFDLYASEHHIWFMLSCTLLLAPYFIAWSALFGFLSKNYRSQSYECLTILFTLTPIGIVMLMLNDIYHVIECVLLKPIYFVATCGRKLRSESFEELGYYKLRRVSEIFSESMLQGLLQLWILLTIRASGQIDGFESNVKLPTAHCSLLTTVT